MKFKHSDDVCDCPSECQLLKFDIENSYSLVSHSTKKQIDDTNWISTSDISHINLYYGHVAYERQEQQKQLQTADLLSNIAGSMGLFLGMSTVTLLEIFIYLFKAVWGTVNSTRQKQFVDAVAEEERDRQQSIVIIQSSNSDRNNMYDAKSANNEERKSSRNSIHIHLDRRNSRMIRGGDMFSAPRESVSIPSQLFSPLSKHNRRRESFASQTDGSSANMQRKISMQSTFKSQLL
uniref:Uncharacterized protein n=1 Tax=Caenorhabditis japonica TaxID=281687 RepID=A0A8R1EKP9_CAEJA